MATSGASLTIKENNANGQNNNPFSDALSMDITEEVNEYFGTPRGSVDIDVVNSVASSAAANVNRMDSIKDRKVRRRNDRKQSDTIPFVRANLGLTKGAFG